MPKKAKKTAAVKKTAATKKPSKAAAKKVPAKKAPVKKAATKKAVTKTTPPEKAAKKKAVKKTAAKAATPKAASKKKASAPKKAKAASAAPAKKKAVKKTAAKSKKTSKPKQKDSGKEKAANNVKEISQLSKKARALLGSRLNREKNATPILFSFDDATALLATRKKEDAPEESAPASTVSAKPVKKVVELPDKPEKKRVHAAASLADILGFDPSKKKKETELEESSIPKKWKKYYRLLIELRQHVKEELDLHTSDTLKHSSRDDSGDLSGYGLHQADAGTDNFDRDFALSLVSNEQDALYEIEEAIQRIKDGSYGVCEVTGKKIDAQRLSAVPFTRFSVEGQSEYEKNKRRKVDRGGGTAFAESGDLPALTSSDDGDE